MKVKSLSRVRLFVTPWIAAHQAPLSMGFSRQEYWSGLPLHSLVVSLGWWKLCVCVGAVFMCINMVCMCEVRECGGLCLCLREVGMAPCMLG